MSELKGAEHYAIAYFECPTQKHRDQVVFATEPVIRSIISRIMLPGDDLARPEELYNIGVIAVLQSLDQFDPTINKRFVTFAYPRIRGEIIDYLRRLDPLPRRRRAKVAMVREAADRLSQRSGSEPIDAVLAAELDLGEVELRVIHLDAHRRFIDSLDTVQDEEFGLRLVDTLSDETAQEEYDSMEWSDVRRHLEQCASDLSERDRTILELYYGEEMTLSEIGQLLGVSEARISQLRKSSLKRLASRVETQLQTAA